MTASDDDDDEGHGGRKTARVKFGPTLMTFASSPLVAIDEDEERGGGEEKESGGRRSQSQHPDPVAPTPPPTNRHPDVAVQRQGRHAVHVTPLDADEGRPMAPRRRFLQQMKMKSHLRSESWQRHLRGESWHRDQTDGAADDDEGEEPGSGAVERAPQMYRLETRKSNSNLRELGCCLRTLRCMSALLNVGAVTESSTDHEGFGVGDANQLLDYFWFWLFSKRWLTTLALAVVVYYFNVVVFALLIMWAAYMDHDCIRVGGQRFTELDYRLKFMNSFSLSWNTFSSVGFGSIYPALSKESNGSEGNDSHCAFINFITAFEALVGLLMSGLIGAVIFAKVSRITQRADVVFSDLLTVRFGSGVDEWAVEDDEDTPLDDEAGGRGAGTPTATAGEKARGETLAQGTVGPSPFPVITFRIANEMHDTLGGEIINASINAVALTEIDESNQQLSEDLVKQINMDRMRRKSFRRRATSSVSDQTPSSDLNRNSTRPERRLSTSVPLGGDMPFDDSTRSLDDKERSSLDRDSAVAYLQNLNFLANFRSSTTGKMKIDDEEDGPVSKIVPRIEFTKLDLEVSRHPLFKRIWRFKHIIGPDSPLLTFRAQNAIKRNKGNWPQDWNNHKAVRKAIRFNQLIVSFTGISNVSGASVYKQKTYNFGDTIVGYKFVNALYRSRTEKLLVDLCLINDVVEQNGGGGEPLNAQR